MSKNQAPQDGGGEDQSDDQSKPKGRSTGARVGRAARSVFAPYSGEIASRLARTRDENAARIKSAVPNLKRMKQELRGDDVEGSEQFVGLDTSLNGVRVSERVRWAKNAVIQWWMGLLSLGVGLSLVGAVSFLLVKGGGQWIVIANMVMGGGFTLAMGLLLMYRTTRDITRLLGLPRDGQFLMPTKVEIFWETSPRAAVLVVGSVLAILLVVGGFMGLQSGLSRFGWIADFATVLYVIAVIVIYRRVLASASQGVVRV